MIRLAHIAYLLLILLLPVLAYLFYYFKNKQDKEWKRFASMEHLARFSQGISKILEWKRWIFGAIIALLVIFALSNPQMNQGENDVEIESSDIFVALDISRSMLANDLKPNRLDRAKNEAQKIIEKLEGNRVGLILFAGEAYMFMPLTDDISAALSFLQAANVNMAPTQGTALSAAIQLAMQSFDPDGDQGKSIVLLSDGEDHEADLDATLEEAKDQNIYVFTVAVGTDEGAYLPGLRNDNYLFDETGKPVKSVVNEAMLQDLAKATGANSFNMSKEINIDAAISKQINQMEKQVQEIKRFSSYDSKFQYLLLPAILLFLWQLFRPYLSFLNKAPKS